MNENLRSRAKRPVAVQLRPVEPGDEPVLVRIYAGSRAEELTLAPWGERGKRAFVEMQLAAQTQHYRAHYPAAQHQIICADGEPIGRLYLDKRPSEVRILDIAVLPENRNAGIGTLVVTNILEEAGSARLPVTVYVETYNSAMRFFENLGFQKTTQDELKVLMRWDPENQEQVVQRVTGPNG